MKYQSSLKKLELDNLSPKESLDILYTLKKELFFRMMNLNNENILNIDELKKKFI